ncbi:MAG: hypothetical protein ACOX5A_01325 [Aminivibrio sp.]|jgi:hypothetical protein
MKKYLTVLIVILALAAPCESSLRAVPAADRPSMVVHSGEFGALLKRLGDSYFFETLAMDDPAGPDTARWLSNFSIESFSMLADERGVRGAFVFDKDDEAVRRILNRMEEGAEVNGESLASLLRYPADAKAGGAEFSLKLENEEQKVYRLEIETEGMLYVYLGYVNFLVTVKKDGDDLFMLFGESEGTLAEVEAAFGDPEKRIKADLPAGSKNFIKLLGDEEGEVTAAVFEELGFKAPAFRSRPSMELSLEAEPGKFALTLRHNFMESILGGAGKPGSAMDLNDPGLTLGGGAPFLAAAGSVILPEDDAASVIAGIAGGDADPEDVKGLVKSMGLELGQALGLLRMFGLVLGGEGAAMGEAAPGGYVFFSGDREIAASVGEIAKMIAGSFPFLKEEKHDGWDFFLTVPPQLKEDLPFPLFFGRKGGVLAAGSLTTEALDRTPSLPSSSAAPGAETLFFARLDAGRVLKVAEEALAGSWGIKLLEATGMNINSRSGAESLILIPRAVRELKGLTLTARPDSISLEAETGDVDYKAIHDFENLVRRRFSAAFSDVPRPPAGDVPPGVAAEAEALAAAAEAKVLAAPVQPAPDPENSPDALVFDGLPAGPEAAGQPAPEPKPATTAAPAPVALQPGPPAVTGKKYTAAELKRMGIFLSNFTELRFLNVDVEEFTDPDDPGNLIRFGIGHNYVNNFKSRIARCKTKNCQWGSMTIDGKFVAESIKKYFDYDYKNVPGEFYGDEVYYYDGKLYHFEGSDGEAVYYARVDEAYEDVNGRVVMKGEIYNYDDKSDIIGKFTALSKPHKFGGKDTWALITLETDFY